MPPRSDAQPFLWGAATSAHQVEGDNRHNDWWVWEAEGRIEGSARSGRAADHWNRFAEDIDLAAGLGLNSYRFSIEWSRLEPREGAWDEAALHRYGEFLDACERRGLVPMATLHHFTSPQWFAEQGGFASPGAPEKFAAFVERVARTLGPRIPLWCTINEPQVLAVGSYLGKFMPPAEYSPVKLAAACANLLDAHVRAYDILHSRIPHRAGPWRDRPVQVGIAHNLLDFMPDRSWHPLERLLTRLFHRFYNLAWLDAVTGRRQHFGAPGILPYAREVGRARHRNSVDFIGVNYYTKAYVQWRPKDAVAGLPADLPLGLAFARRTEPRSDLEWAVHPAGFARVLRMAASYGLPLYVTENGIADRDDRLRGDYLRAHLAELAGLREEGLDIRGYYHWSLIDNFEWIKGFGPRFGLFHVDYETFARTPRASAEVYRGLIRGTPSGETPPTSR